MVAGGPSEASDHRIHEGARFSDRGSGRGGNSRRLVFDTRHPPGSGDWRRRVSGGLDASRATTGYRTERLRRCSASFARHAMN